MSAKKLYFKKYILFTVSSKAKYCTEKILCCFSFTFFWGSFLPAQSLHHVGLSGCWLSVFHLGWRSGRWSKDATVLTVTWHVGSTGCGRNQGKRRAWPHVGCRPATMFTGACDVVVVSITWSKLWCLEETWRCHGQGGCRLLRGSETDA